MSTRYDVVVIGGGIVGLAVARAMTRQLSRFRLAVLGKEERVETHESGHNSGVIHSWVYYKPGSIKARTGVEGAAAMVEFCREHGIPHQICGNVIVATANDEIPRLRDLLDRGKANGVAGLRMIGPEELREIEPHATGVAAPGGAGNGDHGLRAGMREVRGAHWHIGWRGLHLDEGNRIPAKPRRHGGGDLVGHSGNTVCHQLRWLAQRRGQPVGGGEAEVRIVPFRGEYYGLMPERTHLVRTLIYPVPDPRLSFLGVHFTRRTHGTVDAGPNAPRHATHPRNKLIK